MSSIIEIRHEIVQRLFSTEDKGVLQKILHLLPSVSSLQKEGDWWDELDAEEQRFLDESAGEANRDEVVSHETVMAEAESLLRRQRN